MSTIGSSWGRFSLLVLVFATTLGLLKARNQEEILPTHQSLASFPLSFGGWQGRDQQISAETREVLGPGDFLSRDYVDPSQNQAVNLFIAFFPSQRQGDTIHSPKNCLPGAGWIPVQATRLRIEDQEGKQMEVNRFLVEKDNEKALVLYWYQAHGHTTPSEYAAKYHLIADSIMLNRSDGALIRITTVVRNGEGSSAAESRAIRFAQLSLPLLDRYIPR
jgi:EpsI family protein